jgi:hypothetical protein
MKEPTFLVSMKWIIDSIQIQNDLFGYLAGGLDKGVDEELVDCFFAVVDLLVLLVFLFYDPVGFQTIQGALAGQSIPIIPSVFPFSTGRIQLPTDGGQQRIPAKLIVIVGVLIAKTQSNRSLSDQLLHRMFHIPLFPMIDETGSEVVEEMIGCLNFPKQECPGV